MSVPHVPSRIAKAIEPFFDPNPPQKQGNGDSLAHGRTYHLTGQREAFVSKDEAGGFNVAIIERGQSFDAGPYYDTPASARSLERWMRASL